MRLKNRIFFNFIILIVFLVNNISGKTEVITNKYNLIYFIIFRQMKI